MWLNPTSLLITYLIIQYGNFNGLGDFTMLEEDTALSPLIILARHSSDVLGPPGHLHLAISPSTAQDWNAGYADTLLYQVACLLKLKCPWLYKVYVHIVETHGLHCV